jgi:uncharacterized membrane protein YbaN (DUF454 family)
MTAYKGCMLLVFGSIVLLFSGALALTLGLVGFVLPWLALGFVYMFIRSIIGEIIDFGDEHDLF